MKNREWKSFFLNEIFTTIQRGKRLTKNKQIPGNIPYISSTMTNNGTDGFIGNETGVRFFQDCLTIANSGSVGSVFYHDYRFIASDHVTVLINPKLSKFHYLFLGTCLKMVKEKYSFNREISDKRIKNERITLPVKDDNTPDWDFMEKYTCEKFNKIKNIHKLPSFNEISDNRRLEDVDWDNFFIEEIIDVKSGVRLTKDNQDAGDIPFIGAADNNNGITGFINNKNNSTDKNVLGTNYNGSVGYAFYHPYEATFSDDVKRLSFKEKNSKYTLLFLKHVVERQAVKYAYGYKFNGQRMKRQIVKLPVKNGRPDFDFMEQYMKRIENRVISNIGNL